MQPQREPSRKKTASAEDVGLSRDDVEYILSTFREDGDVTREGTFETIMDYFDRMDYQGADYQSPNYPEGEVDG